MMQIRKYGIPPGKEFDVKMPVGAKILHVGDTGSAACFWALVDEDAAIETRRFVPLPTGAKFSKSQEGASVQHVGTFIIPRIELVFHLFEVLKS